MSTPFSHITGVPFTQRLHLLVFFEERGRRGASSARGARARALLFALMSVSLLIVALMPLASALSVIGSGAQPWGSWKHQTSSIQLELVLAPEVKPANVRCEVGEGFLCAWQDASYDAFYEDGVWNGEAVIEDDNPAPPILFGRFAQIVLAAGLEWDVETRDGSNVLTISLPKPTAIDVVDGTSIGGSDAIFDETLHLHGEQCLLPGLSVPTAASVVGAQSSKPETPKVFKIKL